MVSGKHYCTKGALLIHSTRSAHSHDGCGRLEIICSTSIVYSYSSRCETQCHNTTLNCLLERGFHARRSLIPPSNAYLVEPNNRIHWKIEWNCYVLHGREPVLLRYCPLVRRKPSERLLASFIRRHMILGILIREGCPI